MRIGFGTDIGRQRRVNQDALLATEAKDGVAVFAVADGLGGHKGGEIASRMLIDEIGNYFKNTSISSFNDFRHLKAAVMQEIESINSKIYHAGLGDQDLLGMGSTLTMCISNGDQLHIFHVGDSRLYVFETDSFKKLTKDHSLVESLVEAGEITREEAKRHPNKNVLTRAVGTDENTNVDYVNFQLQNGQRFLICSDGLTNYVEEDKISEIVLEYDPQEAVNKLIETANENGGGDNITAIIFAPEVN
ncbi:Stp1/IreP family PP2C-type Ser/Thr phosphatase [Alkalibacter mobilis]|uniref:Stp1/IreP family PP2C-type Ser/Thr phosphatase n=1 Tax=Alkalibacter mobilis TaxID=2787712 RepID=UPI0018A0B338|nr:Stp1/IreP family PP2C-type Ser/Thr phosphatase [Alkalibacter mobilis]MBF7095854.1 Stp1/IreP family PP2C-type Ser/Thr phosphatase [Alkalibacter mobilis]